MLNNIIKVIFITTFIFFLTVRTSGQNWPIRDTVLSNIGVTFHAPNGFNFKDNSWVKERIELHFDCRVNNIRPNILPGFYWTDKDSSVLILVEDYKKGREKDQYNPLTSYHYDENTSILYDASAYSVSGLINFADVRELAKSNADRVSQFAFNCKLLNSEYTQVIAKQYLKFNQGYIKVYYLAKSNVDNLQEIIENNNDFILFNDHYQKVPDLNEVTNHPVHIDEPLGKNMLKNLWNKGRLYNDLWYFTGENYAFKVDSIVVSIQFPSNKIWPYFNYLTFDNDVLLNQDKWNAANLDYRKYLLNAKGGYKTFSKKELDKMNADEGYFFDFSHDKGDEYRNKYRDCKVLLIHKKNVGSMIVKYYYQAKDKDKINKIIRSSLGEIRFKDQHFFENLENKVYPY